MDSYKILTDDIIGWDKTNWKKCLPFWEAQGARELAGKKVLELGGSGGGLSLWAASKGAEVICSDMESPEESARTNHEKYPEIRSRIQYEAVNALEIPYENHFDFICFKSVLGAVARAHEGAEKDAVVQIYKALRNGNEHGTAPGKLLFAENLMGSSMHMFARKSFRNWGNTWHYQKLDSIKQYLSRYFDIEYRVVGFSAAFGIGEPFKVLLGHLDTCLFDWSLPESWRYIFIGSCTKKGFPLINPCCRTPD